MDKLILGLLLLKGRTLYEIRERISQGLNMMYSSSIGSIQAAIKKLLAAGLITCEEQVENSKFKKVYHITHEGRAVFDEWINSPIDSTSGKNPELLKFYYMGFSEREGRAERIENHISDLRSTLSQMRLILDEAGRLTETGHVPLEMMDILNYQKMSAKFGADLTEFQIEWFEKILNDIKEGKL